MQTPRMKLMNLPHLPARVLHCQKLWKYFGMHLLKTCKFIIFLISMEINAP